MPHVEDVDNKPSTLDALRGALRVQNRRIRLENLVQGSRFRISGPNFGFRVSNFGFRVSNFGFRVSNFGFLVRGFGGVDLVQEGHLTGGKVALRFSEVLVVLERGQRQRSEQLLPHQRESSLLTTYWSKSTLSS